MPVDPNIPEGWHMLYGVLTPRVHTRVRIRSLSELRIEFGDDGDRINSVCNSPVYPARPFPYGGTATVTTLDNSAAAHRVRPAVRLILNNWYNAEGEAVNAYDSSVYSTHLIEPLIITVIDRFVKVISTQKRIVVNSGKSVLIP